MKFALKTAIFAMIAVMALSFNSCGGGDDEPSNPSNPDNPSQPNPESQPMLLSITEVGSGNLYYEIKNVRYDSEGRIASYMTNDGNRVNFLYSNDMIKVNHSYDGIYYFELKDGKVSRSYLNKNTRYTEYSYDSEGRISYAMYMRGDDLYNLYDTYEYSYDSNNRIIKVYKENVNDYLTSSYNYIIEYNSMPSLTPMNNFVNYWALGSGQNTRIFFILTASGYFGKCNLNSMISKITSEYMRDIYVDDVYTKVFYYNYKLNDNGLVSTIEISGSDDKGYKLDTSYKLEWK